MDDEPRPCIICDKLLTCVAGTWEHLQPYGGGEISLIFSYGSFKFDTNPGTTVYRDIICDQCAEKIISKMKEH